MAKNLQELIDGRNAVDMLRNSQIGSYIYPVVPADFQNWIKEQKAWRDTAVLYDQSHHMDNVFLKGSDAIRLISDTAINSVATFPVNRAKQYVPTTASGQAMVPRNSSSALPAGISSCSIGVRPTVSDSSCRPSWAARAGSWDRRRAVSTRAKRRAGWSQPRPAAYSSISSTARVRGFAAMGVLDMVTILPRSFPEAGTE